MKFYHKADQKQGIREKERDALIHCIPFHIRFLGMHNIKELSQQFHSLTKKRENE